MRKVMDGNTAVAYGARLSRVQVVPAYPITPQSSIAETLADFISQGSLKAKFLRVESEHSALSAAVGASFAGARVFTATSSVGLALMTEITGVASGCRLPIVMAVANRALCSPWSLWCDHSDTMTLRDQGWIQLYAENCQEALDFVIIAFRVAEDQLVQLPCIVAEDGFFLSHLQDTVTVPAQEDVDRYLPPRCPGYLVLDPESPVAANILTGPHLFTEDKYTVALGMERARTVLETAFSEFADVFGRKYSSVMDYGCDDAETIIVSLGSLNGTVRDLIKKLRASGQKVGLLRIVAYRPFPYERVRKLAAKAKNVIVIDRAPALGEIGPLNQDVRAALYGLYPAPQVTGFVLGLGGRDIPQSDLVKALEYSISRNGDYPATYGEAWLQVEVSAK
ncbi:MAG TPA: pyruvate ferredoxin oxidoreductase [Firmicutes bacterium]|nr:pyruvate ferredoxin oxidoreductase [Candidatus Fermentithermobacillaceae bacterium]